MTRPLTLAAILAALLAGWFAHGWAMREEQREIERNQETTRRNLAFARHVTDSAVEDARLARHEYLVASQIRRNAEQWAAEAKGER